MQNICDRFNAAIAALPGRIMSELKGNFLLQQTKDYPHNFHMECTNAVLVVGNDAIPQTNKTLILFGRTRAIRSHRVTVLVDCSISAEGENVTYVRSERGTSYNDVLSFEERFPEFSAEFPFPEEHKILHRQQHFLVCGVRVRLISCVGRIESPCQLELIDSSVEYCVQGCVLKSTNQLNKIAALPEMELNLLVTGPLEYMITGKSLDLMKFQVVHNRHRVSRKTVTYAPVDYSATGNQSQVILDTRRLKNVRTHGADVDFFVNGSLDNVTLIIGSGEPAIPKNHLYGQIVVMNCNVKYLMYLCSRAKFVITHSLTYNNVITQSIVKYLTVVKATILVIFGSQTKIPFYVDELVITSHDGQIFNCRTLNCRESVQLHQLKHVQYANVKIDHEYEFSDIPESLISSDDPFLQQGIWYNRLQKLRDTHLRTFCDNLLNLFSEY